MFIDTFIDFPRLNDWGQVVIMRRSLLFPNYTTDFSTSCPASDTTQETSASSQSSSSEKSSQTDQPEQTDKSSESKSQEQESKGESSSKDNDSEQDNKDKQESMKNKKLKVSKSLKKVIHHPILSQNQIMSSHLYLELKLRICQMNDDIKPHSSIRQVSPVNDGIYLYIRQLQRQYTGNGICLHWYNIYYNDVST